MPSLSQILAGFLLAAAIACGVLGWQLKRSWQAEATTRAALDTAVAVNVSNAKTLAAAKLDADAERERAIARQRERDNLAGLVASLRQGLSDASRTCVLPAGDLDAIDRFLRGERP